MRYKIYEQCSHKCPHVKVLKGDSMWVLIHAHQNLFPLIKMISQSLSTPSAIAHERYLPQMACSWHWDFSMAFLWWHWAHSSDWNGRVLHPWFTFAITKSLSIFSWLQRRTYAGGRKCKQICLEESSHHDSCIWFGVLYTHSIRVYSCSGCHCWWISQHLHHRWDEPKFNCQTKTTSEVALQVGSHGLWLGTVAWVTWVFAWKHRQYW